MDAQDFRRAMQDTIENDMSLLKDLTLRDYFAGKAMEGLVAAGYPFIDIPDRAYKIADEMLEMRK